MGSPRRLPATAIPLLVLAVVLAALALSTALPTAGASAAGTTGQVDPRVGERDCALLGRVWSRGVEVDPPHRSSVGCRVDACVDRQAKIRPVTGQEVCYFGDQETGPRYGSYVDSRVCAALNRHWMPEVNMCASNPFRARPVLGHARQCDGRATVYLTLRESEGYFDACVPEQRFKHLRDVARRSGRNVRAVTTMMSAVNCALRPGRAYRQDRCVARGHAAPPTGRVLITGESVMWRGHNEIEDLRPDWSVDALPGRQLGDLAARIRHEIGTRGRPGSLIVGLGTNPTPGFERADLQAALRVLGTQEPVMFVLPYRGSGTKGQQDSVAKYQAWERSIARDSPATRCVADFPAYVKSHPRVLGADRIHPAPAREAEYARFITRSWDNCLRSFTRAGGSGPVAARTVLWSGPDFSYHWSIWG